MNNEEKMPLRFNIGIFDLLGKRGATIGFIFEMVSPETNRLITSEEEIAESTGVCKRTVKKQIDELIEWDIIKRNGHVFMINPLCGVREGFEKNLEKMVKEYEEFK